MSDYDYESIEAAVTETVRGRWFLAEFARRTRAAEGRLLLEAMARIETIVTERQAALPPPPSADPSIRLLVQRIKEIAARLDGLEQDMRAAGVEDEFCQAVDFQARAVSGLMRAGPATSLSAPPLAPIREATLRQGPLETTHRAEPERSCTTPTVPRDPRLKVLSGLDGLPLAQKLALFT
jgi:hypothetical protein